MAEIPTFLPHKSLNLQAAIREANRCLLCLDAPCSKACPGGTDPGTFIRQIRFLNFKGAARTIRGNNVLGGVCACICPVDKLCVKECSLHALEHPIDINGLQMFAVDYGREHRLEPLIASGGQEGRVAVVGAGPAGLSCASRLLNMNYEVVVFEREDQPGGVPYRNIPSFRLPPEILDHDLESLRQQGVIFQCGHPVQGPGAAEALLVNGFDAVFISTGLTRPGTLPLYADVSNAYDYNTFLIHSKRQTLPFTLFGKNVAVIGGGSVAIDSALSAKRMGADKVYLISLESLEELPADQAEIELARAHFIHFRAGSRILSVEKEGDRAIGLSGEEVQGTGEGPLVPGQVKGVEGTHFRLKVDLIVQAIGTHPGPEWSAGRNFLPESNGRPAPFPTSIPGIFAGGDLCNGGQTVIQAIREGKEAAALIHQFLKDKSKSQ